MKKIINDPGNYVQETLEGLYIAHPNLITYTGNDLHCLVSTIKKPGKVGLVTGGGSGHMPLFLGYVGKGMLDACAVGNVFQSPSADQIHECTKFIESNSGVLYIYGNYNGDIFNFNMAAEQASFEDNIQIETVVVKDDIATRSDEGQLCKTIRRGVAGIIFVYKCAGAAADAMLNIAEVKRVAEKTSDNVRTMGVALSACTVPQIGKPGFTINENEMEIGMGIHGEPGIKRCRLETADTITAEIIAYLSDDLKLKMNDEVAVLVNGLGASPLDEQYIVVRKIAQLLSERGISVHKYYVGEYATSIDMAGLSITLLKLDDELKGFLDSPVFTPFSSQF